MEKEKIDLFSILNNISNGDKNRWEEFKPVYNAFMINRFLSMDASLIPIVEIVNRTALTPEMQYDFLFRTIPKRKRFFKYQKMDEKANEKIQTVMDSMKVSYVKAKDILYLCRNINLSLEDK